MRVNGILSFLSFCDVCNADCRSDKKDRTFGQNKDDGVRDQ